MALTQTELQQYTQHIQLEGVGKTGQNKLKHAKVLCVGLGGLGTPVCLYLASAGVGTLGLVDADKVERSNLPRQILYTEADIEKSKVALSALRLQAFNPHCEITTYPTYLTPDNALAMIDDYDIVLDCSDNFATRYLISDAAQVLNKLCISASLFQHQGMVAVFSPQHACYRCLFESVSQAAACMSCQDGVLNTFVGWLALMQANEAIKIISGLKPVKNSYVVKVDGVSMKMQPLNLPKNPTCALCTDKTPFNQLERPMFNKQSSITYKDYLAMKETAQVTLIDVRSEQEYQQYHLDDAINVPLDVIPTALENKITDKTATLVLYCHLGRRSLMAKEQLLAAGYQNVFDIAGGLEQMVPDLLDR